MHRRAVAWATDDSSLWDGTELSSPVRDSRRAFETLIVSAFTPQRRPRATKTALPDATGPRPFAGMMPARYESLQRRA